ncbi:beta-ketoacyl synthase [Bacteroides sp. 51]|uniref:beta-ketoacyl-[acyl-carrier-protein] synthase family protein n=1 Tax=Bacteroides sp. 51 TaxID=2302938 RepID=UPI0013D75B2C|nr:beta-ketoacyl synthase N-terminal-like domain-containing protein [Bacteroides sp. 51]NDV81064.1 beta-ACP synthase [Bacteroides sp. 51]
MGHQVNIYLTADNIISALGFTTQENIHAIRNYQSGVKLHTPEDGSDISDIPVQAATINKERVAGYVQQHKLEQYSRLEQLFILSITETLSQAANPVDLSSPDSCIIFSTTKGNIDLLSGHTDEDYSDEVSLWKMVERVAGYFHAGQNFRIISNACISGVSALVVAKRLMEQGKYKQVLVAGGDVLSHFITSGFISFKSVSPEICRPFDAKRDGLSLGEACATILLTTEQTPGGIVLAGGGISNDANHISGPSRTGDGLYYAMRQAMEDAGIEASDIDFVNTHGTATVYNDEMESKAIHLAELQHAPVNSMKSYFGHTLGAAGIIETIVCAHELKEQTVFGTLGFEELGVPMPIKVHAQHIDKPIEACVKTASGFGGCNAAIVLIKPAPHLPEEKYPIEGKWKNFSDNILPLPTVSIKNGQITVNSQTIFTSGEKSFPTFIREAYKTLGESNMKFYKMDDLCKLGYMACHYILKDISYSPTEIGIILANKNASLHTDIKHQTIIVNYDDAAASPAVFVYTLPNVVIGEICIRHKIQGENSFFINKECNLVELKAYACTVMHRNKLKYCVIGWCELLNDDYEAEFELLTMSKTGLEMNEN